MHDGVEFQLKKTRTYTYKESSIQMQTDQMQTTSSEMSYVLGVTSLTK